MRVTHDTALSGGTAPTASTRRATRRSLGQTVLRVLRSPTTARLLFPVAVLIFWLVSIEVVQSVWPFAVDVLPRPSQVWDFVWAELTFDTLAPDSVYGTFLLSLQRLGAGWIIAMVLGTVIGLGMGLSKGANAFFNDWVVAILAMPTLAWALFVSLAFGFGDNGPIIVAVLTGIPFVIINVREGVRNAPRELFDMSRSFKVPGSKTTRHVLLPSLMPFMFAAARYAFALGWKGVVVTEVFGGQDGAGWTLKFWYDAHRAHGVVGYAFFFMAFAILFERVVFDSLAKRVFKWRPAATDVEVVEEVFDGEAAPRVPTTQAGG